MNSSNSPFLELQKRLQRAILRRLKRLNKSLSSQEKALLLCDQADSMQHFGDLLKANFHLLKPRLSEITVPDWLQEDKLITIPLDPKLHPDIQIKVYYHKAKKLRRGKEPLQKACLKTIQEQDKWKALQQVIEQKENISDLLSIQQEYQLGLPPNQLEKGKKAEPEVHVFQSRTQHTILVGKNAAANEQLTFQMLRGDDLWLHVHHMAGSHVGIRRERDKEFDEETLLDAATLALYFSKARAHPQQDHEVVITERSSVHRIKGAPKGKVSLSKMKTLRLRLDLTRIERLKTK